MPAPLYTADNCTPAYQLDWSYSVFWRSTPTDFSWLDQLRAACEPDHIRLLEHQFDQPNVSKFLISTQPDVAPLHLAQRVKGRLQHLIRHTMPAAFRRNYGLRSVGSTKREKLDHYLQGQLVHHPMADPKVQERLRKYQIHNPDVDLSEPSRTTHALYWYNLHLVLVNDWRGIEIRDSVLQAIHDTILKASKAKGHRLSRGAILADHIHLTMRCKLEESPQDVALSYINNLAYAQGMKAVFKYSYFVGTFGEYDLGVIPRP